MGQKVHPIGIRLGIVREHNSNWYANGKEYADNLHNDIILRRNLHKKLKDAAVSKIKIEYLADRAIVTIHSARPGKVIGQKGVDVEKLRTIATKQLKRSVHINIAEIRKPELDAFLVAQSIATQLERRVMFRRAMKRAMQEYYACWC